MGTLVSRGRARRLGGPRPHRHVTMRAIAELGVGQLAAIRTIDHGSHRYSPCLSRWARPRALLPLLTGPSIRFVIFRERRSADLACDGVQDIASAARRAFLPKQRRHTDYRYQGDNAQHYGQIPIHRRLRYLLGIPDVPSFVTTHYTRYAPLRKQSCQEFYRETG